MVILCKSGLSLEVIVLANGNKMCNQLPFCAFTLSQDTKATENESQSQECSQRDNCMNFLGAGRWCLFNVQTLAFLFLWESH